MGTFLINGDAPAVRKLGYHTSTKVPCRRGLDPESLILMGRAAQNGWGGNAGWPDK